MIIDPSKIPIAQLQGYLQSAVAPRPIALASTIDKAGNVNLSPFSFFNVFSANPPILVFSPARRVTNNTTKHTLENVLEVPEVVINIVHFPMVEQVSLASTEYERGVNEFIKAGLTAVPSQKVKPPRVSESPVAFECTVEQIIPLGDSGGAGNLVIAKVQLIHIQDQYLDEQGRLDTTRLDLVARMGGNWYAKASGAALFEIPKPLLTRGIGVDQLPEHIRQSTILNGNNLGRLGNVEQMPDEELLQQARKLPKVQIALSSSGLQQQTMLHYLAKEQLDFGNTSLALAILMLYEL
jgi:flavin reductase (DIM6/NTAB) family NADH-FMN oxidoreductase RutF